MGVRDIYCVICGITTSRIHHYNNDIKELKEILKKGKFNVPSSGKYKTRLGKKEKIIDDKLKENYEKFIKDFDKLKNNFKWCDDLYIITENKLINVDKSFKLNDMGGFSKNGKYYATEKNFWDEYSIKSLCCHKSCYKLLLKKLNYKLKIEDVENKLDEISLLKSYGSVVNKYKGEQDFPWTWMILNVSSFNSFERLLNDNEKIKISKNVNYLIDPLKNKINEDRILKIWKPIANKNSKKKILKKDRPSPSESATLYNVGKIKKGNDGNMYEVVINKNKVKRWKKK
jgi:hypothetical protein